MGIFGIENEHTEFKSTVNDSAIKTIVAFANCEGGTLYIGVDDNGSVIGLEDIDSELLRLTQMMQSNIRPDILMMVSTEGLQVEGKDIIVATVQSGPKRPYYLASKGLRPEGVFVRSGAASVHSSDTAIVQMIKSTDGDSFEDRRSLRQDLTFHYLAKRMASKGMAFGEGQQRTLGIRNASDEFTNLGLLLSDQCPMFHKAATFDDDDRTVFLERVEFSGSLLQQLDDAYAYLEKHNRYKTSYQGLDRIDYHDYPPVALREALVNAVAHREYALSGPTLISVMPSNIQITSLGGLPLGITVEDLSADISLPRNRLLANVLYRLQIIEAYGTGMTRMRVAYENQPEAVAVKVTPNSVTIALANRNAVPRSAIMGGDATAGMNDCREQILRAIANGSRTRSEIQRELGYPQSRILREISNLINDGLIKKVGGGRSTTYEAL